MNGQIFFANRIGVSDEVLVTPTQHPNTMSFRSLSALIFFLLLLLSGSIVAQSNTQTVRGTVLDADSHQPVFGAGVAITTLDPVLTAITDDDGRFTIANVPTGRIDLRIRAMGFEEQLLPNLLVVSSRESVLNIVLESAITEIKALEVSADKPNGQVRNDMATVSARKIGVEETSRIAGSINDPARMVSSFPGVANDPSGDNTIMVRGNSPKGVLWRLEGIEIPNPNHFSDEGTSGGPINVLNSDMIDDSEFYTGAFAPEFGNAYSAVFDMRLRDGNDEKREYTLKAGVLGTDLTAEGPLPGVKGGSYLANYRYSTLALLDDAGIVDYQGVPKYTDAAFKLKMPTANQGTFNLFGIGGISHIIQEDRGTMDDTLFSRADFGSRVGVVGLSNTRTLGENSFLYSTVSLSGNSSSTDYDEAPSPGESALEPRHDDALAKWTVRYTSTLNNKLSAKHKLRSGITVSTERYRMGSSSWDVEQQRMLTELNAQGKATTVQAFTSWKWRWNEQWSMTSGIHMLHYTLNGATSIEPRAALRWQMEPRRAVTLGVGLHSRTEAIMTYMAEDVDAEGNTFRPNEGLGLTRAAHAVAGFEQMLSEDIRFKVEAYYQHQYGVPVENDPNSSFSLGNSSGWFTNRSLVNEGVGRTYGIEASLEKFFTKGYHFMLTGSVSDARYKPLDGVWYNSRYNMGVVANALAGKEWKIRGGTNDRVLTTSFRYSVVGGQYQTPIDLEASIAAGEEKETGEPWSVKGQAVHKLDLMVAYRIGRPKVSHEFKADVQNVLNAETTVYHYYDDRSQSIKTVPQLAMLPVLQYTLRF